MKLAADAMTRAGTTEPARLRAALAATKDFPGVTGRTTINARRDADNGGDSLRAEGCCMAQNGASERARERRKAGEAPCRVTHY